MPPSCDSTDWITHMSTGGAIVLSVTAVAIAAVLIAFFVMLMSDE